jgi:uncharacterized protein
LTDKNLNYNLSNLEKWFKEKASKAIIAFSGGVDSCLVSFLANKFLGKENVLAIISASPSLKQKDLNIAVDFCNQFEINLEIIVTKELDDSRYSSNPVNRCYFCKTHLYDELKDISQKYPDSIILNGQNFDDLSDYRPGIKAAVEFKVYHPLADCNLSKNEIRELARYFNLPTAEKPASPCLSSRIPYGQEVTVEKLKQIEAAENLLNEYGFYDVRVRHFNDIAKIEVPINQLINLIKLRDEISTRIQKLGFNNLEIDQEGLVSGKLNRSII